MAPHNRGIVLDLVVFLVNLFLVRALVGVADAVMYDAVEDVRARFGVGLFFAVLVFIQPLGPLLKRWSFHQRHTFATDSGAGCLLFWFMFVYLAMMFGLCAAAAVFFSQFFSGGEGVGVAVALAGFAWSVITVGVVYRYFVPPTNAPRWVFLTTPAAAHLGDACIYLNAICLQILWGSVTASGWFTELVTRTPLGRPGSATDILGRLIAIAVSALVLYLPVRIFYLAEDKHRTLTWATMLLANLPLILRLTFAR
ncbi:MAG: hypothetical protein JWM87_4849 [Candidatus Eremiobacteraeota bacterium]|nr:hypothetical protein [Candidatus Eremiobacteraeota bacterium]